MHPTTTMVMNWPDYSAAPRTHWHWSPQRSPQRFAHGLAQPTSSRALRWTPTPQRIGGQCPNTSRTTGRLAYACRVGGQGVVAEIILEDERVLDDIMALYHTNSAEWFTPKQAENLRKFISKWEKKWRKAHMQIADEVKDVKSPQDSQDVAEKAEKAETALNTLNDYFVDVQEEGVKPDFQTAKAKFRKFYASLVPEAAVRPKKKAKAKSSTKKSKSSSSSKSSRSSSKSSSRSAAQPASKPKARAKAVGARKGIRAHKHLR